MTATRLRMDAPRAAPEPAFLARRMDRYYQERVEQTWDGGHIMAGRKPEQHAIRLMSNDYLCMARHPEVLAAQRGALETEDDAMLMAAVFLGDDSAQAQFERSMAGFMHAEASVLTQSGWMANTGLLQTIADAETPVYVDMIAHASLWEGVHSAGARSVPFRHNTPEHLERQLRRHGPGVIVVDSVYSTNGNVAPLTAYVTLAERYGCVLVVDEAHSLGTHGPEGRGLVVELGLEERVHCRTASLAKAFAGRAGLIACSSRMAEYIKYNALPAIFSSGLLPHEINGLEATRALIQRSDGRRRRLHANADYLRAELSAMGYNLDASHAQILGLEAGSERRTMLLRDALEARGVFGSVFCAPATPKKRSMVRLTVHCDLTREALEHIVSVCYDIRDEVALADWPSSRRKTSPTPFGFSADNHALAAVATG